MSNLNSQLITENKLNEETLSQELEGMSLEQMGEFFDSHSMADYWEETVEVEVEAATIKPIRVTHFKDEKEMSEMLVEKA